MNKLAELVNDESNHFIICQLQQRVDNDFRLCCLEDIINQLPKSKNINVVIVLYIMASEGGDLFQAFYIEKYIQALKKFYQKVTVVTIGGMYIQSAATIIHQLGNVRILEHGAEYMIHMYKTFKRDKRGHYSISMLKQHKKEFKMPLFKMFTNHYLKGNKYLSTRELKNMLKRNTFLSAYECKRIGLTDDVASSERIMKLLGKFWKHAARPSDDN